MSPPRCHFGSSDNGMPVFGNTSFSITPVHRHYIFKPRGAETEPLLALWDRWRCPVVILVIASSQWMCCAVWFHFILYSVTSILVLWFIALLETPNAACMNVMMEFCNVCPLSVCPVVFCLTLCTSAYSMCIGVWHVRGCLSCLCNVTKDLLYISYSHIGYKD